VLGDSIREGMVITKYGHVMGDLPGMTLFEAGHPVPDANSFRATEAVLAATEHLTETDTVLLLISGGGSALFEAPLIPQADSARLTEQLLASGAGIVEMNTIRKRFSKVKGGRFAMHCLPARVYSIILSDIIGDPLDMIASGPAYPDSSTVENAVHIAEKYRLTLTAEMQAMLHVETPKTLTNVETVITGSVRELCHAAAEAARALGYAPQILTDSLDGEAREAGGFLAAMARYHQSVTQSTALIVGGETVVRLTGKGLGGRNQELALAAAQGISGLEGTAIFSLGSDGTDGPTDAAGGYVDGQTLAALAAKGIDPYAVLQENDAYHALAACGGLIMTGPTGTNVNDVSVLLIRR
ncbi:MAG: DUF4147 domain-containing protein, partial [Candidatus Limiplasma sp.]|nr:DUF4147 domain-containing protein [Candidatus Limiplasma sp.]